MLKTVIQAVSRDFTDMVNSAARQEKIDTGEYETLKMVAILNCCRSTGVGTLVFTMTMTSAIVGLISPTYLMDQKLSCTWMEI